jgi:hypothetical protein
MRDADIGGILEARVNQRFQAHRYSILAEPAGRYGSSDVMP